MTEELDRQLPGYQQSKREVGRILKELKALYCVPGCRGQWQQFLRSRGLAVSTANDLIRRYAKGDSSAARPGKPQGAKPAELMTLRLPIDARDRGPLKAAIAKLGRDRVAALIYSTVIQAAQSDAPICPQKSKVEPKRGANPGPYTWRNYSGFEMESAGSGRFQHNEEPSPDGFSSPASRQAAARDAGLKQAASGQSVARQGGRSIFLNLAELLTQRPARPAEPMLQEVVGAARPNLESAGSGRLLEPAPPLLANPGPSNLLPSNPLSSNPGPARDRLFQALIGEPEPGGIRNDPSRDPKHIPDSWGELLGAAMEPYRPKGEGCPWFLSPYDSDGRRMNPHEISARVTRKILLPALLKIGYETPHRP